MNLNKFERKSVVGCENSRPSQCRFPSLQPTLSQSYTNGSKLKTYNLGLESQNYWVEHDPIKPSTINRSSVSYNILNHGKNHLSGRFEDPENYKHNKKVSVSKFADLQNTYHHRQCDTHKVY